MIINTQQYLENRINEGADLINKCIIPIFKINTKKSPRLIGSSIFIKLQNYYILLSASHVFGQYTSSEFPLVVPMKNDFFPLEGRLFKTDPTEKNSEICDFDFAILRIGPKLQKLLLFNYHPIGKDDIHINHSTSTLPSYFFSGFPVLKENSNDGKKFTRFTKLIHDCSFASEKEYREYQINQNFFLLYKYLKKRGNNSKTPKPYGISGGGIFFLSNLTDNLLTQCKPLLIGLNLEEISLNNSQYNLHIALRIDVVINYLRKVSKKLERILPGSNLIRITS